MMRQSILLFLLLFTILPARAGIEVHQFKTPKQEARYRHLTHTLRCLVCQNEDLADSNAELAGQLRAQIYKMITSGSSDKQIVDYMVSRYGDFVLYKPPFMPTTYLLWIGPFALLLIGIVVMQLSLRRNRKRDLHVDKENYNKARQLLADEDTKS